LKETKRDELFELIVEAAREGEGKECRLGIRIKAGGYEAVCPLTQQCHSYRAFELEMDKVRERLDEVSLHAKNLYERTGGEETFGIKAHMSASEVWAILSGIAADDVFVMTFNTLEEAKRREIAEHVLTRCNVFSGKASVFSSRYSDHTALME
jgi:hypothetical protein